MPPKENANSPSSLEKREFNVVLIAFLIHKTTVGGSLELRKIQAWAELVVNEYNTYIVDNANHEQLAPSVRQYFTRSIQVSHVRTQWQTLQKGNRGNYTRTCIFADAPELNATETLAALEEENNKFKKLRKSKTAKPAAEKSKRDDQEDSKDDKPAPPPGPQDASSTPETTTQQAVVDVDTTMASPVVDLAKEDNPDQEGECETIQVQ